MSDVTDITDVEMDRWREKTRELDGRFLGRFRRSMRWLLRGMDYCPRCDLVTHWDTEYLERQATKGRLVVDACRKCRLHVTVEFHIMSGAQQQH